MRRSIQLTALLTTTVIALAGCGGSGSGSSSPTSGDSTEVAGELTWWDTSDVTNEAPVYKEMVAEFMKKYPKVKVTYQSVPFGEAQSKFKTAASAKSGAPDILRAEVAWVPEFASLGYLYKLDGTELTKDMGDFLDASRGSTQYNGGTYGVPQVTDTLALFYNKKMLAEAGVQAPTTWDEMKSAAAAVKSKTGKDGVYLNPVGYYLLPFIYGEGGDLLDPAAKKITVNAEPAVAGITKAQELLKSPGFTKAPATEAYKAMNDAFINGQAAMIIQGPWEVAGITKAAAFGGADNLGVVPVPAGSKKAGAPVGGHDYVVYSGMSNDKAKAATEFIKFMSSAETQAKVADKLGVLPSRKSAYEKVTNPMVKLFQPSMAVAVPRSWVPEGGQLFGPMDQAATKVMVNMADPKSALTEVADKYKAEVVKDYTIG
ncbi:Diacetylchitobiose binding protein DasA [Austwickia sp. TVS 96-490-7B]|uniref:extracellular solute-binding protein n=1 Tax=Austwickia sp. TVS 96-490-7B TaxID=2830843 RepID=UPI001C57F789|nr:extracellular solute-binding protein [Austwickia sp. TVS 96-490-7B]MBW3083833.1 Diacetylchitobiose binding protein DasA [Austwickia sp. TVS 96-490-7B]